MKSVTDSWANLDGTKEGAELRLLWRVLSTGVELFLVDAVVLVALVVDGAAVAAVVFFTECLVDSLMETILHW